MKPEPLKGKETTSEPFDYTVRIFKKKDIRSAVEWLKEIHKKHFDGPYGVEDWANHVNILIDKAFEDVMK